MTSIANTSDTHGLDRPSLTDDEKRRAIASVANHPLYLEAHTFPFCEPVVEGEPKDFIERFRYADNVKDEIRRALEDVDRILIVSFWTSDKQPQPLSGGGRTFDFILHPVSMAIVHSGTGTWRS